MSNYRILIPSEYESLRENIPKTMHRNIIDLLLFSGMRYSECSMFVKNLTWFDAKNRVISLPEWATKTNRRRDIHLTPDYSKKLDDIVRGKEKMEVPHIITMARNLKRWACNACESRSCKVVGNDVFACDDPNFMIPTPKTFRKTWESWLLAAGYPSMAIALSQGHSELISYGHYANLDPRLKSEMDQVRKLTGGWGT